MKKVKKEKGNLTSNSSNSTQSNDVENKQTPECCYTLKNLSFLLLVSVIIFLSSIGLSISFDYLFNADWFISNKVWIMKIFIIFIPVFWILFLIFALCLSCFFCNKKQRNYKASFLGIILSNILLLLFSAIFLYSTWVNKEMDYFMWNKVPWYRNTLVKDTNCRNIELWQNEEKWLLIWEIIEGTDNSLLFTDSNNKEWTILLNDSTKINTKIKLDNWKKIKIIWEKEWDNIFKAKEIILFSWYKKYK